MKKFIYTVISAVLIMSVLFTSTALAYVQGDTDNNGTVTAADARFILRASVGLEKPDAAQLRAADYDGNGVITAADARMTLRVSVGLPPTDKPMETVWLLTEIRGEDYVTKITYDKNYFIPELARYDNYGNTIFYIKNTYDADGNIFFIHRNFEGEEEKIDITLDENNNWKKVIWYSNGNVHRSYDYSFDKNGNMLTELEYLSDDGIYNRTENTYDSDGLLLKSILTNYYEGETIYTDEYTYASDKKLTAITSRMNNELLMRTEYTYDSKGNILTECGYDYPDGKTKTASTIAEYTCDENGNILTEIRSYYQDTQKIESIKVIYTYDENGNQLTRKSYMDGEQYDSVSYIWISAELPAENVRKVLKHAEFNLS